MVIIIIAFAAVCPVQVGERPAVTLFAAARSVGYCKVRHNDGSERDKWQVLDVGFISGVRGVIPFFTLYLYPILDNLTK